jgi:hypothetical protein
MPHWWKIVEFCPSLIWRIPAPGHDMLQALIHKLPPRSLNSAEILVLRQISQISYIVLLLHSQSYILNTDKSHQIGFAKKMVAQVGMPATHSAVRLTDIERT